MTATGQTTSLAVAKAVPIFLTLVVAYCSYVVVGPLSIQYLLDPPDDNVPARISAGIAIPIVWFVLLLLPVAATYLRLLVVVFTNPGYVPLGDETTSAKDPPPDFWMKDVFVCDQHGRPKYCYYCQNWKPDRAHHNQDVGRCTLKMDHFCPWVGGVVGERALKFFVQFLFYSVLISAYLTAVMAYFVHESRDYVQWIVALALGAFFLLFTIGMAINTVWMVTQDITTIENIDRLNGRMHLAVLLPPEMQPSSSGELPELERPLPLCHSPPRPDSDGERPLTSEIDDPAHSNYFSRLDTSRPLRRLSRSQFWRGTVTYPLSLPTDRPPLPAPPSRTFAILETPPGLNPWDLGSSWRNFKAVLGDKVHQWFLPYRLSPVCDHSSPVSFYPMGPQFEELLEDAGLVQRPFSRDEKSTLSSSKRRRRKLERGWQDGERPDGWDIRRSARRGRRR